MTYFLIIFFIEDPISFLIDIKYMPEDKLSKSKFTFFELSKVKIILPDILNILISEFNVL